MASDPFVIMFLKAQAAASGAILLVMILRLPVRWMLASAAPVTVTPKAVKPGKSRRKNV